MSDARSSGPVLRPHHKPSGWVRLVRSFSHSARGLRGCWREEEAFRQECVLALFVLPAGIWLGSNGLERAVLVAPMFLILIVELLNSAVEAAIDRIGVEHHALSGLAKDLGSAAVLVAFALLVLDWVLILSAR